MFPITPIIPICLCCYVLAATGALLDGDWGGRLRARDSLYKSGEVKMTNERSNMRLGS